MRSNERRPRTAAIVPAYNEAETIDAVVGVLVASPLIDEVIVVDDGSTDATGALAAARGARVIRLESNRGKGAALAAGCGATDADILMFFDADLIGLRSEHVENLLAPVRDGQAAMAVGVFEGGRIATDLAQVVAPFLSGQRALRRELVESLSDLDEARFGVEMALTQHARRLGATVVEVELPDLTHRMKEEKAGLVRGVWSRMKMYWEIVKVAQRARRP